MDKNFDQWNQKKKQINKDIFDNFVHTREVWWCSLGINIGFEQDGKHEFFERPVLVLKKFSRDMVLVIPLTSKIKEDNKYFLKFTHNDTQFSAIISQLRLISTKRLRRKIYSMDSEIFNSIRHKVKEML